MARWHQVWLVAFSHDGSLLASVDRTLTGAGARIGREMALYLGQQGYDVAVHYATSHQAAEEVAELLRGMGRNAIALQADLLDESAVQNLVPATMQALGGPITCLINNASIFEYDNIKKFFLQKCSKVDGTLFLTFSVLFMK